MNEVNTKIEEAQKAGEVAGTEAGNRMHQEVYRPSTGTSLNSNPGEKDASGNPRQSDHLPGFHIDNNRLEGALLGADIGMAAALVTGQSMFAPEATVAGALIGVSVGHK